LIADDHRVISYGIQLILKHLSSFYTFQFDEAGNGNEVLAFIKKTNYDLIILDINMPDTDLFGLVDNILANNADERILIYSSNSELLYAKRLYKQGIKGYLSKEAPAEEVNKAITQLLDGYTYISYTMKEHLLNDIKFNTKRIDNPFDALTNREIQIAQCLINGNSVAEIKTKLHLHSSSIGTYKSRIFEKLQISSLHELNKLAQINGFS
jgi:DNA-binding NarL/FixJ family response regulator